MTDKIQRSETDNPITLGELRDSYMAVLRADQEVGEPICATAAWAHKFVPMMLDQLDEIAVSMIVERNVRAQLMKGVKDYENGVHDGEATVLPD